MPSYHFASLIFAEELSKVEHNYSYNQAALDRKRFSALTSCLPDVSQAPPKQVSRGDPRDKEQRKGSIAQRYCGYRAHLVMTFFLMKLWSHSVQGTQERENLHHFSDSRGTFFPRCKSQCVSHVACPLAVVSFPSREGVVSSLWLSSPHG